MRELFNRMRLGSILKLGYFRARPQQGIDYKKPLSLSFPRAFSFFLLEKTCARALTNPYSKPLQFRNVTLKLSFLKLESFSLKVKTGKRLYLEVMKHARARRIDFSFFRESLVAA